MDGPAQRILLVDDKASDRELAALVLARSLPDVQVEIVADAMAFAEQLAIGGFHLVICERHLGWSDGLQLLTTVKRRLPDCPVLFFTSASSPEAALEAMRGGLDEVVSKSSAGFLRLPQVVQSLLARSRRADAEEAAHQVLGRLPVGVFSLDGAGLLNSHNRASARLLGADESAHLGGTLFTRLLADPEVEARVRHAIANRSPVEGMEVRIRGLGGQDGWARLSLWPAGGGDLRFEGTLEDISAYKRREQDLSRKTDELDRSNTELERFAYVASHDLQEPLSLIERYGELMRDRLAGRGEGEMERYLDHMLESSRRSQTLVEDLLAYARIGTRGRPFEPVDFGVAVDAAAADLQPQFAETQATLQREPLPTLPADRQQIVQLFQNLFSNALKFAGAHPPEIRVSAREEANYWKFTVSDRGIGIAPEHQERIFEMFQRLHTAEEYPGTGIGLAICKSIVERHHGRIWVESQAGHGAAFHFTIAK